MSYDYRQKIDTHFDKLSELGIETKYTAKQTLPKIPINN